MLDAGWSGNPAFQAVAEPLKSPKGLRDLLLSFIAPDFKVGAIHLIFNELR